MERTSENKMGMKSLFVKYKIYIIAVLVILALIGFIGLIAYFVSSSEDSNPVDDLITDPSVSTIPERPTTKGSPSSSSFDTSYTPASTTEKLATTSVASVETTTSSNDDHELTSASSTAFSETDLFTDLTTATSTEELDTSASTTKIDLTTTADPTKTTPKDDDTTPTEPDEPEDPEEPDDEEKDNLLLENSKKLNSWINNENWKFETHFYYFNVTNSDDVLKKKVVPILSQVGPYKFVEKRIYNLTGWENDKKHLNFRFKKNYFPMEPEKLNDEITVLNVPLITLYNLVDEWELKWIVNLLFKKYPLFVTHKVGDLLFNGYDDNIANLIKTVLKLAKKIGREIKIPSSISANGRFSHMASRNDSDYGIWTVNTGKGNPDRLGQLYKIDGKRQIGCWTSKCELLEGSDGVVQPPSVLTADHINIFLPEMIRSIQLDYEEDTTINKVSTMKFAWSNNTLKSKKAYDLNDCFYPPGGQEDTYDDYSGILRNSHCNFFIPMVFSLPHFYQGDRRLVNQFVGLEPVHKYRSYIHLRKDTGELQLGKKSIQVNIDTKVASAKRKLPRFIFPLLWLSEFSMPA